MPWDEFAAERHRGRADWPSPRPSTICTWSARTSAPCAATRRAFLEVLQLRAAPAAQARAGRDRDPARDERRQPRKVPDDAPTAFVKPRWKPLVITPEGIDRRFYEICALVRAEERAALRRHLGEGFAPVPGLRGIPAAAREVRRAQAGTGAAIGDQPELRPVPAGALAAAGPATGHRQPAGQGQRTARRDPHRDRTEDHARWMPRCRTPPRR